MYRVERAVQELVEQLFAFEYEQAGIPGGVGCLEVAVDFQPGVGQVINSDLGHRVGFELWTGGFRGLIQGLILSENRGLWSRGPGRVIISGLIPTLVT